MCIALGGVYELEAFFMLIAAQPPLHLRILNTILHSYRYRCIEIQIIFLGQRVLESYMMQKYEKYFASE